VPGYAASPPRTAYYSPEDAVKLLRALPQPNAGIEAMMYACGWELAACKHALVKDIDITGLTAYARGTKNDSRERMTVITEPDVMDLVLPHLRNKLPNAKVWPNLAYTTVLNRHYRTCEALKLQRTTLHDWRHTYAHKELDRGVMARDVADMLGNTEAMVLSVYGKRTKGSTKGALERVQRRVAQMLEQSKGQITVNA
jgi:integrase